MTKQVKTGLIVAAVLGVGYAVYRFYKRQIELISQYDYKIIGAKINKLGKNEVSFNVKFRFFNKAKIEAQIEKIYLDLYVEGVKAGYLTQVKPFIIPANGNSDIDLQISFNPQLVLGNVVSILLSGVKRKDINFTLDGSASIRSGFVSTVLPIKYSDVVSAYL